MNLTEVDLMPAPEEVIKEKAGDVSSLRTYLCHKKVRAGQIQFVTVDVNDCFYLLTLKSAKPLLVSSDWYKKHKPKVDGYVVVYEDNYMSYSPKEAFENGYTLINPDAPPT